MKKVEDRNGAKRRGNIGLGLNFPNLLKQLNRIKLQFRQLKGTALYTVVDVFGSDNSSYFTGKSGNKCAECRKCTECSVVSIPVYMVCT